MRFIYLSLFLATFWLFPSGNLHAQGGDNQLILKGHEDDSDENLPLTMMRLLEENYNFGEVKQGQEVRHTFRFINDGDYNMVLEDVKPSCSCTTLEWPKEAIAPGDTAQIVMAFSTEDKSGEQRKYLTIFYNGNPPVERISITGTILEGAPSPEAKPEKKSEGETQEKIEFNPFGD